MEAVLVSRELATCKHQVHLKARHPEVTKTVSICKLALVYSQRPYLFES